MIYEWDAWRALVWAVRDQRVDAQDRPSRAGGGADFETRMMGGGTAGPGARFEFFDTHPDAELVYAAARRCPDAGLIVRQARTGGPPAWEMEPMRIAPVIRPNARPRERVVELATKELHDFCPLRYVNGPEEIRLARGEYAAWHAALVELTLRLRRVRLQAVVIVPLKPHPRPWELRAPNAPRLSESDRVAFIAAAWAGAKAGALAARFGLSQRQAYSQLEACRARGELPRRRR